MYPHGRAAGSATTSAPAATARATAASTAAASGASSDKRHSHAHGSATSRSPITQPNPRVGDEHQREALVDREAERLGDAVGAWLAEGLEPEGVAVEGERGGPLGDREGEGHGCVGHACSDGGRDPKSSVA